MESIEKLKLENIPHYDEISAAHGLYAGMPDKNLETFSERMHRDNKVVASIGEAIRLSGLKDSMTISFHHHFRNGDHVVNMVMDEIAKLGIKNLTLAASSLTNIHAPLVEHIKNGVVTHIETSGLRGELAEQISRGLMEFPVVFRSHGGRAAAIESRELHIDVAFLGAPSCDPYGNANGYNREADTSACGSMGYAKLDALYADCTVIITDNLVSFPNAPFGIPESNVDYVVKVESIGDEKGIMSGATRFTKNPKELLIAQMTAEVVEKSGYFYDGFSMQMGTGGASLATARFLREKMIKDNIKARFALGGITGQIAEMLEEGLVRRILDVQSFDLKAASSLKNNRFHQQIDAAYYASYLSDGAAVNQLDFVILSALEIDTDFNVNVLTGSDGVIRGAIGGHPDTAAGASLTIVVAPLMRGRIPSVVKHVNTVVTPGASVDVLVTDQGVAVNPARPEIRERLDAAGIRTYDIEELRSRCERIVGAPDPIEYEKEIVGIVMYRDNTVIDVIRRIKDE